jgi:hypothetical protein
MSSSCSTTIMVLPISRNDKSTFINLRIFGCKPILGSSNIYMEPTNLPSDVAKLIRWDSHQKGSKSFCLKSDNLNPLRSKKDNLLLISIAGDELFAFRTHLILSSKNVTKCLIGKSTKSETVLNLSLRRRLQCVDAFSLQE